MLNILVMNSDSDSIYHLRLSGNPELEHLKIYKQLVVKDHLKRINKLAKSGL